MTKPFVCNGDFSVKVGNNLRIAKEVLDILHDMGLQWSGRARSIKERYLILGNAIADCKEETSLIVERKEKAIYFGGTDSWRRRPLHFTYDEFKKEIEECG